MNLWHSSDWHLSFNDDGTIQKPMHDRKWSAGTKHYVTYLEKIQEEARSFARDDVLCITGDITHEVGMQKILPCLMWIYDTVPCNVVLIRGNHDQRLKRDQIKALLQSSSLWHRMDFLWEGETKTVGGLTFHCCSDHQNDGAKVFPRDDAPIHNADVLLCHYPVPESRALAISEEYIHVKAFLSGHIHCTSNNPEIAVDGIAPHWYNESARPTDNKRFGNCLFSTGTTDVLEWQTGRVFRKIL
jgi:predicted phosphohydrolase